MKRTLIFSLLLLLCFFLPSFSHAIEYQETIDVDNLDEGYSVIQDANNDYIVAGIHENSAGTGDHVVMAMRLDPTGLVIDRREYVFEDQPLKVLVRGMNGNFGFVINFKQSSSLKRYLSFLVTDSSFSPVRHSSLTNPYDEVYDYELVDIETHLSFPGWVGSILVVANVYEGASTIVTQPYGIWVGRVDVTANVIWADILRGGTSRIYHAEDICEDAKTFCWWITGYTEDPQVAGSRRVMYFYVLINETFGPFTQLETGGSTPTGLRIYGDFDNIAIAGTHETDGDPEKELFFIWYDHDMVNGDSIICANTIDMIPNASFQSPEVLADFFYDPYIGFTLVGNTVHSVTSNWNMYMMRIDTNCTVEWTYRYGKKKRREKIRDAAWTPDGFSVFGSIDKALGQKNDYYSVKTNYAGQSGCDQYEQNTQMIPIFPLLFGDSTDLRREWRQTRLPVEEKGFTYDEVVFCLQGVSCSPAVNAQIFTTSMTIKSGQTEIITVSPPQSIINPHTYVWTLNGVLIPGATSSAWTIYDPGTYTVIVTNQWGCSDTVSITILLDPCKWNERNLGAELTSIPFRMYPNPGNGTAHIELATNPTGVTFEVWDIQGRLIYSDYLAPEAVKWEMDLIQLQSGLYQVRLRDQDRVLARKKYVKY